MHTRDLRRSNTFFCNHLLFAFVRTQTENHRRSVQKHKCRLLERCYLRFENFNIELQISTDLEFLFCSLSVPQYSVMFSRPVRTLFSNRFIATPTLGVSSRGLRRSQTLSRMDIRQVRSRQVVRKTFACDHNRKTV